MGLLSFSFIQPCIYFHIKSQCANRIWTRKVCKEELWIDWKRNTPSLSFLGSLMTRKEHTFLKRNSPRSTESILKSYKNTRQFRLMTNQCFLHYIQEITGQIYPSKCLCLWIFCNVIWYILLRNSNVGY